MKIKNIIFSILFIVNSIDIFADYEQNKIFIKIKQGAPELENIKSGGSINILSSIIKDYKLYRYISDKALYPKNINTKTMDLQSSLSPYNALSRTYFLEYKDNLDPVIFAKKIMSFQFVELAEPIPVNYFTDFPNDTLYPQQYYLNVVKAIEAAEMLNSQDTVIVGIVDSGVDYLHEDLEENMYINYGETGTDSRGRDKRTNGIDDDGNGYIDDYRGWDFLNYSDSTLGDNDPMPGNTHGTHVAGTVGAVTNNITGIAGIAKNVKILPVKIGPDEEWSRNTVNSYPGILYAAKMGARIINCSWGGSNVSETDKSILEIVSTYNCLVLCAAGNDGENFLDYPAAYEPFLAVAALNTANRPASFTNYDEKVGISAPGVDILATVRNNQYSKMSGTSMATPVTAGCAALLALQHPEYKPEELKAHLQATADKSIYDSIPKARGLIGAGLVNAYSAVTEKNPAYARVNTYKFKADDIDYNINLGDTIALDLSVYNVFKPIDNLKIEVVAADTMTRYYLGAVSQVFTVDKINSKETILLNNVYKAVSVNQIPLDTKLRFIIILKNDTAVISYRAANILVNKTYLNHYGKKIATTISGKGNIGYNDYPQNSQGIGFTYNDSPKLLFEGSIIMGRFTLDTAQYFHLWDMARTQEGSRNNAFALVERAKLTDYPDYQIISAKYQTKANKAQPEKFQIYQRVYFFKDKDELDYIVTEYNIRNMDTADYENIYLGLFFDWDHGSATHSSKSYYVAKNNFSYTGSDKPIADLLYTGVKSLSSYKVNYNPILNDSKDFGIYDGFTDAEKFLSISSGIKKTETEAVGDVSEVMAAGPFSLNANETKTIAFSILAGENIEQLSAAAEKSTKYFEKLSVKVNEINSCNFTHYPNPSSDGKIKLKVYLSNDETLDLILFDDCGRVIKQINQNIFYTMGINEFQTDLGNLQSGNYFLALRNKNNYYLDKITIVK